LSIAKGNIAARSYDSEFFTTDLVVFSLNS